VQRQISDPLTPPSQLRFTLSEAVDAVLAKGLQPNAKKRWTSATTFAIALGRALERLPAERLLDEEEAELPDPVRTAEAVLRVTSGFGIELPVSLPNQRIVVGQVRAAHLRVLSRLLQHHLGEGGMAKMVNEAPELAQAFAPTLAPLAWVELADLVHALDRARERVPSQLVSRKVGRGTMSATFPRLFGADPASLPAETVLTALPTCWNRFHDWGDITVDVEPNHASVVMGGYAGSVEVCTLVEAELERIVELTGAREVNAVHTTCACTGDDRCEFRLAWTSSLA
jgi:hypothetical protein